MSLLRRRGIAAAGQGTVPVPASPYETEVLADSPSGYWRLGDSGATAVDKAGSNDGTWSGTYVAEEPGAIIDDADTAVRTETTGTFCNLGQPHATFSDVTIELWFKGGTREVRQLYSADNGNRSWQFRTTSTGRAEFIKIAGGGVTVTGSRVVTDGFWHHLAVTYDGANIVLYVDGKVDGEAAATGAIGTAVDLRLGAIPGSSGDGAIGTYDEAALYDFALAPARVTAHFDEAWSAATADTDLPVTSGLVLDLDADKITGLTDGDPVTFWPDGSRFDRGANALSTGPTYRTNVVNTRPVVRFDGTAASRLAVPSLELVGGTMFAVVLTTSTSIQQVLASRDFNRQLRINGSAWQLVGAGVPGSPSASGITVDQFHILEARVTDTEVRVAIDGGTEAAADSTHGVASYLFDQIGARGSSFDPLNGDIARLSFYETEMTSTDRDSIRSHLATLYGITLAGS